MAYIKLKNHVGEIIGNKGPVAAIVAKYVVEKVPLKEGNTKVEIYAAAEDFSDKMDKSELMEMAKKAKAELAAKREANKGKPRKKRKQKKTAEESD